MLFLRRVSSVLAFLSRACLDLVLAGVPVFLFLFVDFLPHMHVCSFLFSCALLLPCSIEITETIRKKHLFCDLGATRGVVDQLGELAPVGKRLIPNAEDAGYLMQLGALCMRRETVREKVLRAKQRTHGDRIAHITSALIRRMMESM